MNTAAIRNASEGDILRDAQVPGLQLRALKKGKSFLLYYRTRQGKERRPKIGDFPTITLDQARKIARDMLLQVAAGEDPMAERQIAKSAPTLEQVWERYAQEYLPGKKTGSEDQRMWDRYFPTWIRATKAADLSYDDLNRLHKTMQGIPYQANRVVSLLSKMLNLCEVWGIRPLRSNPCLHVARFREAKRRRYMSKEEMRVIFDTLEKRRAIAPRGVAFIYLLIFTGARSGEIAKARWCDLHGAKLVLAEHKTDHRGEDRVIHLSSMALEVINGLPKSADPTDTIVGIGSPKRTWESVRDEAGCPDLRLHDLRHSFASLAISSGYTLSQIGELLGHSSTATTKRYAHLMEGAAAEAVEAITQGMAAASTQGQR